MRCSADSNAKVCAWRCGGGCQSAFGSEVGDGASGVAQRWMERGQGGTGMDTKRFDVGPTERGEGKMLWRGTEGAWTDDGGGDVCVC